MPKNKLAGLVDSGPLPSLPAGPSARSILIAIAFVAGFAELAYAVMNLSAMPVYLHLSMGYETPAIAGIGTAFLFFEGVMKGPFGILGDRIGRKWLIVAGPAVSIVTAILTLFVHANQWYFFVFLRILDGLGAAALWPSALVMIADVVSEEKRSQAMSMFNVTYLIGIAIGPFIGGVTNDVTHMVLPNVDQRQASFYLISILFAITAFVAYWRLPDIRPHHEHLPEIEAGFSFPALIHSLKQIPSTLIMSFVTFFGVGLIMLIIKLFAMAEFKINETTFGALLLVPCLIIAVFSVSLGTLGDRIGRVKAIRVGLGVCATSMWAIIFAPGQLSLVIGGSCIGVGFVIAFPAWMAHVSSTCAPSQRGGVMGAVGTAQGIGAMSGAFLGGLLYQRANWHLPFIHSEHPSHYMPFIGCAIMLIISWVISMTSIHEPQSA
ncbi:MAG: MFS transporter [Chthonomonadales bacterium]